MPPGESTLARIAAIATILGAIAACLALIPAFGLWRAPESASSPQTGGNIQRPTRVTPILPATITRVTSTSRAGEEQMIGGVPMMFVPAGEFLMGSTEDEVAGSDERPQHKVYLDAFWIDKYEVTNTLYKRCVEAARCQPPFAKYSLTRLSYYDDSQFEDYPVVNVSWDDAKLFCEWSGKRLPTEAEWEKAARGTGGQNYPWGYEFDQSRVNNNQVVGDTTRVGSYPNGASSYGVMDMAGNVGEWVADWYDASYYRVSPERNPTGPASGNHHVQRGGSFGSNAGGIRAAIRFNYIGPSDVNIGFRCVL